MQTIITIIGGAIALIVGTFFTTSSYTKRKVAEKELKTRIETTEKQQKATQEVVKQVAEEKKAYETEISTEAPQRVSAPASSSERLDRLRKHSTKSGE